MVSGGVSAPSELQVGNELDCWFYYVLFIKTHTYTRIILYDIIFSCFTGHLCWLLVHHVYVYENFFISPPEAMISAGACSSECFNIPCPLLFHILSFFLIQQSYLTFLEKYCHFYCGASLNNSYEQPDIDTANLWIMADLIVLIFLSCPNAAFITSRSLGFT